MSASKILYKYGYESCARTMNGFAEMFGRPDFEARVARLIAGLPVESVQVVKRLLERLRIVVSLKDDETVDLYTEDEQLAFEETARLLNSRIVELEPNLFIWNGYALPIRHFEPNVFLDEYGLRYVNGLCDIGDKAIIDAGAFIGDSALFLSPLTAGRVYAFEPMPDNFKLLKRTISLNGLQNVEPVNKALGDQDGVLEISVGDSGGAFATLSNKIPGTNFRRELVEVVTLDGFVRDKGLTVGLIKTDVEGAEQMLIKGALDTIKRDRPILLISIYHNASDFLDIKPLIESLNLGYVFSIHHPPLKSISGETLLICESRATEAKVRDELAAAQKARRINWQEIQTLTGKLEEKEKECSLHMHRIAEFESSSLCRLRLSLVRKLGRLATFSARS